MYLDVSFVVAFRVEDFAFQRWGVVVSPHSALGFGGGQINLGEGERVAYPLVGDLRDEQRQVGAAGGAWFHGGVQRLGGVLPVGEPGVHGGQPDDVVAGLVVDVGR